MTISNFSYDECLPHRDGKRRAVDSSGNIHVVLCADAPGDLPVRTYREKDGLGCMFLEGGRTLGPFHLVGAAPEAPREWWVNRYSTGSEVVFSSQIAADEAANQAYVYGRIECINVVEKRS